ncbi:unnamed protein product [Oikopleura dioica]|uniref:E2 ubiquitin-conjugating enzyme n=1 Tax=Oikopleura dioica TaxID=34765 RepID=E4X4M0_OIKDI|nr:unnamed protein product [Oikopleura dioica]CBY42563.1 unnamed protein product [Oikopleura dioica]
MSRKSLESYSKKTRSNALKRLKIELAELSFAPMPEFEASPVSEEDFFEWNANIHGPANSPYENGIFKFNLKFPQNYPFSPPECKFLTRIYHCNVNSQGFVCVDILKDAWIPSFTISSILLSMRTLMADPNPYHSLVGTIGQIFLENRELHDDTARDWTSKYAMNSSFNSS